MARAGRRTYVTRADVSAGSRIVPGASASVIRSEAVDMDEKQAREQVITNATNRQVTSGTLEQVRQSGSSVGISQATACGSRPVTSIVRTPASLRIHVSWRFA